ncbi:MAG: aldehyde dehydrogenase family protein, partial [Acidobacteria bacterium]|nr:aldehyde dehydrogenase family protein [Acidobacteriota bacterium]
VWEAFRGLRTVGVVSESKDVVEIASPRGVVCGIIPSTNPTSTAIFKILIAIKSRNAIVLSPHPSAAKCINETARIMREVAIKEGLPADAIGCMSTATIEGTEALMKNRLTAVILATGGIGLVRAAYSSGKPAFGVGPGNVPVFVERTADVPLAVQNILTGKTFDNGTICASEQAVVVDAPVAKAVRTAFAEQGGHFLNAAEADNLAKVVTTAQRTLNPGIVGKSVEVIAKMAGLNVPQGTRCLMVDVGGVGREHPLSMEKLSPILAFYVEDGVERGAARCFEILSYGGMGHTAGIHTRSRDVAKAYGMEMPASRVVVNTPTTHGAIGFSTALPPSMTLGCGSWGGNVTSDNISPLHLMDIKRVAFETRPVKSARPAQTAAQTTPPSTISAPSQTQATAPQTGGKVSREDVAAIVDRFLSNRNVSQPTPAYNAPMRATDA